MFITSDFEDVIISVRSMLPLTSDFLLIVNHF